MHFNSLIGSFLLSLSALSMVSSHVTANPRVVAENDYVQTNLRVPHGCGNSSTVKIIIDLDNEVLKKGGSFTPQLVGGWKLTLVPAPTDNSTQSNSVSEAGSGDVIATIIYSDNELPHNVYADFGLTFKSPKISDLPKERNGTLYFGTSQLCKNGQWQNWTTPGDAKFPPPQVVLTSANATTSNPQKASAKLNYASVTVPALLVGLAFVWA